MQTINRSDRGLSDIQQGMLVALRMVIGWHFLYEGIAKMLIPNWTAAGYLENSRWIFAPVFHWIAENAIALKVVDLLNIWGLTLIGLSLFFGLYTRLAAIFGVSILGLYYVANPPFIGIDFGIPTEGHYLFVNKTLVEMMALAVIAVFPTGSIFGLDRFLLYMKQKKNMRPAMAPVKSDKDRQNRNTLQVDRRDTIKYLTTIPIFGGLIYGTIKKYQWEKMNAITGATIKISDSKLVDLKGELPKGKFRDLQISRIIMGGNLIGGWSHSRDLRYVSSLFKAYNTEKKIFETLALAEHAGINMINITHSQFPLINKYKRIFNSNLHTMCQIHPTKEDTYSHVDKVIDAGVDLVQIQGNCCDWRVRDGEVDVLVNCIDYIRKQGYPAGLGAHSVQALMECEKAGIEPDFFMKTLHHDQYWSAHPRENRIPFQVDGKRSIDHNQFHDNMFCLFPEQTIEFMKRKEIPFFAFKVLAGGAIHPNDAFKYAFENGADFVCVGMFDWQIVDDVNIAMNTLANLQKRERAWYA